MTKPRLTMASGTLLVVGLVLVFLLGWFFYRAAIPPTWLRDFGSEIALRAAPDPAAAPPEDVRQVTPRGRADHPYICAAAVIHEPWDRLVFVTAAQDLRAHQHLSGAAWPATLLDRFADQLKRDQRYQLVVLLKDNAVLDAQLFYTFWTVFDAVARPEGFTPAEAIFTAAVKGGTYVLSSAENPPVGSCAGP